MKNIGLLFGGKVISDRGVACRLDTSGSANSENPLGLYILDERGDPVPEGDTIKWGKWLEADYTRPGGRHLAEDTIGPYWVSTVFLALDHGFGEGPPVLWETIVFGTREEFEIIPGNRRRSRKTVDQFRYTSKAEALAGHARAVKLAESLPQPV